MLFRLLESNDCETAAGHPGRAVIILLIGAALLVLATSVLIAVQAQGSESAAWRPSAPEAAIAATYLGLIERSLNPASQELPGETGYWGVLRD
jgi:hypothetical protein